MAIHDATKNQVTYRLTFPKRDANARDAIAEHALIGRFRALLNQGKPIPRALGEYILSLIETKKPARRPIDVQQALNRIAMGCYVEALTARIGRTAAIARASKDYGAEPEKVSKAHSFFMRLAGINQRRGIARKK